MLEQVRQLLRDRDSFAAIELIQGSAAADIVAPRYDSLTRDLYWKAKDLPAVIVVARAGILYCLGQALHADPDDRAGIDRLRSSAKTLAFNLGSFTWPGWDEPEVLIAAADLPVGLDAARLNLRLAGELNKPTAAVAAGHWLLGAHHLAAREYGGAIEQFSIARSLAEQQGNRAAALLETGYSGLARMAGGQDRSRGERELDEALASLRKIDSEESRSLAEQLETARRVFMA